MNDDITTMLLGSWGTMRDPGNNTVAEAQDGRIRRGEDSRDPLDDDDSI